MDRFEQPAGHGVIDPVPHQPIYGSLKDNNYVLEPFKRDVDFYTATLNWNLGWAKFTSVTGYGTSNFRQSSDGDGSGYHCCPSHRYVFAFLGVFVRSFASWRTLAEGAARRFGSSL